MAVAGQSTSHHYPIDSILKGVQYHQNVYLARAGQLNDLNIRRVLHAQATGEIGCCIRAVLAAISYYLEASAPAHSVSPSGAVT
jgi:hypothetical protein